MQGLISIWLIHSLVACRCVPSSDKAIRVEAHLCFLQIAVGCQARTEPSRQCQAKPTVPGRQCFSKNVSMQLSISCS